MLGTAEESRTAWADSELATVDRLFTEFDRLPVRTVSDVIGDARPTLRDDTPNLRLPEQVETGASQRLPLWTAEAWWR